VDNRPVNSAFLRIKMAGAITLVLLAAVGSWLINRSFGADVVSKTLVADALDDTQIGVVDLRTEFLRLTLSKDVHKAGIVRGEMRRALRTMAEGRASIAAAAPSARSDRRRCRSSGTKCSIRLNGLPIWSGSPATSLTAKRCSATPPRGLR